MPRLNVKTFFLFCMLMVSSMMLSGREPLSSNPYFRINKDSPVQVTPARVHFGFGMGALHSDMQPGPLLIMRQQAFCSANYKNPVLQSKALFCSSNAVLFLEEPQKKEKISWAAPQQDMKLSDYLKELQLKMGEGVFFIQVNTDQLAIRSIKEFRVDQYELKKVSKYQPLYLLGYLSESDEPLVMGWVSYKKIEEMELSAISTLLESRFSLYSFEMDLQKISAADGVFYPCQKTLDFPFSNKANLVNLAKYPGEIYINMRYAGLDNIFGKAVYPNSDCLVHYDLAQALISANRELMLNGYALKVWDAYRPLRTQYALWELLPDRKYVASPELGSLHNRGSAVSLTLVRSDGSSLEMPTDFEEFTEAASSLYSECSEAAMKHRTVLHNTLKKYGLKPYKAEWWHFYFKNGRKYPVLD